MFMTFSVSCFKKANLTGSAYSGFCSFYLFNNKYEREKKKKIPIMTTQAVVCCLLFELVSSNSKYATVVFWKEQAHSSRVHPNTLHVLRPNEAMKAQIMLDFKS